MIKILFLCAYFLAGKPKKNNALKSLAILLGPDFITDIIEVNDTVSPNVQTRHRGDVVRNIFGRTP